MQTSEARQDDSSAGTRHNACEECGEANDTVAPTDAFSPDGRQVLLCKDCADTLWDEATFEMSYRDSLRHRPE